MKNRKGFIGPIGDDLPSLLMVMLAMGLFFSSVIFVFNSYNTKLSELRVAEGSLEIARVAMGSPVFEQTPAMDEEIASIAAQHAITVSYYGTDQTKTCQGEYLLAYFVVNKADNRPARLIICVKKPK